MKINKILWVVLPIAGILIAVIIGGAFLLISSQQTQDRYYEQMNAAKKYLEDADYSKMVEAYELAMELNPEKPEPYVELAEYYMDEKNYYEANAIANRGWETTRDDRLKNIMHLISEIRLNNTNGQEKEDISNQPENLIIAVYDEKTYVRNSMLEVIGEFCYQQYINEYGNTDCYYDASTGECRVTFKSLRVNMYFRNTSEYENMVDPYTKKPADVAKPYKVELLNPGELFVNFPGAIGSERLSQIFGINLNDVLVNEAGKYFIVFDYLNCKIRIQTDAQGNYFSDEAMVEIAPLNLVSDWEPEEEEPMPEPEEDPAVFVLAGETYSYDITEIRIYGEYIDDLTPLTKCENLRTVVLYNCQIADLSPIGQCTTITSLTMNGSTGNIGLEAVMGLVNLSYFSFHGCQQIIDLSPIMNMELDELDTCFSGVSYEQCVEYKKLHPNCLVWYSNYSVEV